MAKYVKVALDKGGKVPHEIAEFNNKRREAREKINPKTLLVNDMGELERELESKYRAYLTEAANGWKDKDIQAIHLELMDIYDMWEAVMTMKQRLIDMRLEGAK